MKRYQLPVAVEIKSMKLNNLKNKKLEAKSNIFEIKMNAKEDQVFRHSTVVVYPKDQFQRH